MTKPNIRKQYYNLRNNIHADLRKDAELTIVSHLTAHAIFKNSQHIACYLGFRNELSAEHIIQAIWQAKKHCYLPILSEEKILHFARYEKDDALTPNRFSILEPVNTARRISPNLLELVILPLVAFDKKGHRVGTGGGYYDRTFAFLHQKPAKKPILVGLAYSIQEAEKLPADPWDIQLDYVLTEKGIVKLG